jgi:hypothetical protein
MFITDSITAKKNHQAEHKIKKGKTSNEDFVRQDSMHPKISDTHSHPCYSGPQHTTHHSDERVQQ